MLKHQNNAKPNNYVKTERRHELGCLGQLTNLFFFFIVLQTFNYITKNNVY